MSGHIGVKENEKTDAMIEQTQIYKTLCGATSIEEYNNLIRNIIFHKY